MAATDWVVRAREFLDRDAHRLKSAQTDIELRVAVMDAHAVLESSLRGYLSEIRDIEGIFDKSKMSFRALVQIIQEETGASILNEGMVDSVLAFNRLRNYVVHDGYTPTYEEVQPGITLAVESIRRLVGEAHSQPSTAWEAPFNSIANSLGGNFTYNFGVMLIVFSILYIINPIDFPGPLDDVGLTAPCIFTAAMLINAARRIRNRSSGKK